VKLINFHLLSLRQWVTTLVVLLLTAGCNDASQNTIPITTAEVPTSTEIALPTAGATTTNTQATVSVTRTPTDIPSPDPGVRIPLQEDWIDCGTIFEAGAKGEWDYYLWGGFAFSVIKKNDTIFLYYQGASDYRTEYDETVLWRAIGVATSLDGIHFSKHEGNPILTWFPTQSGEEGAVSSGVTSGPGGETFLFYGANTAVSPITVNADSRAASSLDGYNFKDLGIVLDHNKRSIWGSGDELFVVDAIYHQGQWIIYYIPNGTLEAGLLAVSYGEQFDDLKKSTAVTDGTNKIPVWGTAGHVRMDEDSYALILNNVREKRTEIRLVSPYTPHILSEPVAVYQFEEMQQANLLLDEEKDTWYMFYRTYNDRYALKLASASGQALQTACNAE
jgi:hypothetical protein